MSRILIIEDEDGIRRVLKKILLEEDSTHEVHEARDGKAGVEVFESGTWDLVFCDIKMPQMDGTEVLDRMMATNPEVPVIMISGHGDINTAVDCLKKGAFDYLPKPPDLPNAASFPIMPFSQLPFPAAGPHSCLIDSTKRLKRGK